MELELTDGGTLYYEVHGDCGEWLVFLNGALSSTLVWAELAPLMAKRHRLLLVDFRDQGRSSKLEPGYAAGLHCNDLLQLFDNLRIGQINMMGISYGGQVAMAFARDHQMRLRRLILASVTPRPTAHLRSVGEAWCRLAEQNLGREFMDSVTSLVYSARFHQTHGSLLAQRRDLLLAAFTPEWFQSFVRISQSASEYDYNRGLAKIEVPTLLVCGSEDRLMPPREMFAMAEKIPNCECLELPGVGHGSFVEAPRAFAAAVLGFTALELE